MRLEDANSPCRLRQIADEDRDLISLVYLDVFEDDLLREDLDRRAIGKLIKPLIVHRAGKSVLRLIQLMRRKLRLRTCFSNLLHSCHFSNFQLWFCKTEKY